VKKAFLLMVVPALLAALAFAQTPAADNTDQTNIKGCLAGSDGNYTVVEDNTGHIFKISSSSVDLKPHVGHDVALVGQRASEASSAADAHSFAVTELKMISEQCAAAAAAPAATVAPPAETAVPPAAAAAPAATAPAATVAAPTEIAAAPALIATEPAATVAPPAETAVTPAPAAAEPAATIAAPAEIASTPAAVAAHAKPAGRKVSASPDAAAAEPAAPASAATTSESASAPAATTSSQTDSTPAAAATMPAQTAKTGSFAIFIAFSVLVILLGILTPFLRRWRKQRMLEGTDAPNLSFTHDAKSDVDKSDPPITRKAA
jgi:hypothetical protein